MGAMRLLFFLLLLVAAGCSEVQSSNVSSVPADTLQEVVWSAPGAGDDWYLYNVSQARVTEAHTVLTNPRDGHIYVIDLHGNLVQEFGSRGGGPGQFRGLQWASLVGGDTIMTYDSGRRKLDYFNTSGRYLHSDPVVDTTFIPMDGLGNVIVGMSRSEFATQDGVQRALIRYDLWNRATGGVHSLGSGRDQERHLQREATRSSAAVIILPVPFARTTLVHTGKEFVYLFDTEFGEVQRFSHASLRHGPSIKMIVERADTAISAGDRARYQDSVRDTWGQGARTLEGLLFPATMPTALSLFEDWDRNLWVERYRRSHDDMREWVIFAPGGYVIRRCFAPASAVLKGHVDGVSVALWTNPATDEQELRGYEGCNVAIQSSR